MKNNIKKSNIDKELAMKVFHSEHLLMICKDYNIQFDQLMDIY